MLSDIISKRFEAIANHAKLDEGEAEYAMEIAKARCEDAPHDVRAHLCGELQSAFRLK